MVKGLGVNSWILATRSVLPAILKTKAKASWLTNSSSSFPP
jgi:hypothetical protein